VSQSLSPASPADEAWQRACARLAALGSRIAGDPFPDSPADRVAGLAHLAEQALCWVGWSVFHADPLRPAFQRQNDPITQWGGPNADNVYRHARVEPGRRYRITGRMHSCEEMVLAVRAGFMHQPVWGTLHEVTLSDLGIGPGGEIDLVVGPGGDVPLPAGAATVSIREYYFDWRAEEPAVVTITCLDDEAAAPAPRLDGPSLAARIDDAVTAVEHSITYWNGYMRDRRAEHPANAFAPPLRLAKGLDAARYGFCFWELGPDEALVVETEVPDARYWSFQLYQLGWFELVDVLDRQSSLNHTQAALGGDGRVRVVVAHADPGVPNWLDTGGRAAGLLTFRWFWPSVSAASAASAASAEALAPVTRVVPLDAVPAALPAGTPAVDAAGRAAALAARRAHLAWRFRT
jgi:hypothetical protein